MVVVDCGIFSAGKFEYNTPYTRLDYRDYDQVRRCTILIRLRFATSTIQSGKACQKQTAYTVLGSSEPGKDYTRTKRVVSRLTDMLIKLPIRNAALRRRYSRKRPGKIRSLLFETAK